MDEKEDPTSMMMYGPPRDLHELYLTARAELSNVTGFYPLYFKLYFLIDTGKEMLQQEADGTMSGLRREAEDLLCSPSIYPASSQLERSGENYRMGASSESTGLIEVSLGDIERGIEVQREQQAAKLIPKLKRMDSKILFALIDAGIIEVKKPLLEDLLVQNVLASIQEQISDYYLKMQTSYDESIKGEEDGDGIRKLP